MKKTPFTTENALKILGALALFFVAGFYNDTVRANGQVQVHDVKIAVLEAMRPQVQDILLKVDSMEKSVRDMRDARCGFKKQKTGE